MNWTTENPTAPGFYWIRRQESVAVVQVDTVGRVQFFGVKHVRPEEIPPGVEWYGPLTTPSGGSDTGGDDQPAIVTTTI